MERLNLDDLQDTGINEPIHYAEDEPEESEESIPVDIDDLLDFASDFIGSMKKYKGAQLEAFKQKYISFNRFILYLIRFDKALGSVKLSQLGTTESLMLGFGAMIGTGLFLKAPEITTDEVQHKTEELTEEEKQAEEIIKRIQEQRGEN